MSGGRREEREEPDLGLSARASARSLRFETTSKVETEFRGDVSERSFSTSRRYNLPAEVREGVEYHNAAAERRDSVWTENHERAGRSLGGPRNEQTE
ncbi:hypothetical protein [Rubrobacter aplysinae]|uniref:hypothetical protein n=1 Tax=Rubrobacter aplysinae TaxID=909625 RepID=UPI00064C02B1|nr:hypothetical protein [Rubrobacter aplysinae]